MEILPYKLRIKRGDFEFEVMGDKEFVESKYYEQLIPQSKSYNDSVNISKSNKILSLVEFIRTVSPKGHPAIITCFGYYLEKYKNQPEFGREDLISCYAESKMQESSNTSQMMTTAVQSGLIMPVSEKDGKRQYKVTQSGDKYVEEQLQKSN